MQRSQSSLATAVLYLSLSAALVHAATVSGTVTNKTTNRPSAGDTVTLVDVQAGMADAATAITDSSGKYSLNTPGMGAYLIRVTHQGAGYFIAAPQGADPGDVTVYDVAPKVDGVGVDADMLLVEAGEGTLRIHERFLIRNNSQPPKAQFSDKTFEVALPAGAELDSASTTRPGGMGTNTHLVPLSTKGHYTFSTPIQPSQNEKQTIFELQYHMPYSGTFSLHPAILTTADNFVVYLPLSMTLSNVQGANFQQSQDNPQLKTYITKNVRPNQAIAFTLSGEGQAQTGLQQANASAAMSGPVNNRTPGGGIGTPIDTPDPLSSNKWWILSGLVALLLVAGAFILKRGAPAPAAVSVSAMETFPIPIQSRKQDQRIDPPPSPAGVPASGALLLNAIKEELFAIEGERLSGNLPDDEYARIRVGLEAVLKRLLNQKKTSSEA